MTKHPTNRFERLKINEKKDEKRERVNTTWRKRKAKQETEDAGSNG